MPLDILLAIVATAVIQSLFGVGVLLFGTPILLLLGYDFINALVVLLPVSIAINLLQIIKHYNLIDISFVKDVLRYTIPFVVVFLFIVTNGRINIGVLVGCFLIVVALKDVVPRINQALAMLVKYERSYLTVMGIVHGLTNLGGSLLTAIVHGKRYQKDQTRVTIAVCYAMFAVFQMITLAFLEVDYQVKYADNVALLQYGVIVFLLTEEAIYARIDNEKYSRFFAAFLLASGVLLITKSV
ncbi:MAG: TSUP family transporter [Gammaproteobacteria bacterium]